VQAIAKGAAEAGSAATVDVKPPERTPTLQYSRNPL
jgi:hypothetical protein